MPYYAAPFTFEFGTSRILVDVNVPDVDCASLYNSIKLAQASEEGIIHEQIASGSGLVDLGPGVKVGITIELLGNWQVQFPDGNYIARIAGGNLVGGPGGDPIAYSAGVQTLLIQSAASTVVTLSGEGFESDPSAVAEAIFDRSLQNHNVEGTLGKLIKRIDTLAKLIPGLF
jgi:hypothetical protein